MRCGRASCVRVRHIGAPTAAQRQHWHGGGCPVFARLRSVRCWLLCCGGRRGAAATDGAARGCGAVPIPHTGEENTPKPRGGVPK